MELHSSSSGAPAPSCKVVSGSTAPAAHRPAALRCPALGPPDSPAPCDHWLRACKDAGVRATWPLDLAAASCYHAAVLPPRPLAPRLPHRVTFAIVTQTHTRSEDCSRRSCLPENAVDASCAHRLVTPRTRFCCTTREHGGRLAGRGLGRFESGRRARRWLARRSSAIPLLSALTCLNAAGWTAPGRPCSACAAPAARTTT